MLSRILSRSLLALLAVFATSAHAQFFRTYLALDGNDANPCTLQQPCRLLPAALAAVAPGGEIWLLDAANYNTATVNVTKSVTILAVPGVVGSVVAAGGPAISIATAGVEVALRNLVIVPLPGAGGTNGVSMTLGAALTVENCLIANVSGSGIAVSTPSDVRVTDTTIRGVSGFGILVNGGAKATVTRARVSDVGSIGLRARGDIAGTTTTLDIIASTVDTGLHGVSALSDNATADLRVSVSDSLIARNDNIGVTATSGAGAEVSVAVTNNRIVNNGTVGVYASGAGVKVWASANTVSNNGTGMWNSGAIFETAGNNAVRNNFGSQTLGTITVVAME